jgi:8-amino-7-oxononanoate synthase
MDYIADLTKNRISTDGSIMGKVHDFKVEMRLHEQNKLNVYKKYPQLTACDREVTVYDRHHNVEKKVILFGSNSYLGATNSKTAIEKSIKATIEMGIGSGGVPLLTGTTKYQNELEEKLSKLSGFDDTILFSSGYTANLGVISGLIRKNNLVIHDKLDHASLLDGTIMCGAKMLRYKHGDINDLEVLLSQNIDKYPHGILVVTDGVFSMDGDIANIPAILNLVKKYNSMLLIDEAHAVGVIGEKGAGTLSHYGIEERENIIITGTLSKAIGTLGGYISGSQEIIDYLRIYARSNMFSTSLPPSICAAAEEVISNMSGTDIVQVLREKSKYLRTQLIKEGFNILNSQTPIIPVIVGNPYILTQMVNEAFSHGFLLNAIFPPAVPANMTRFRISVMATHTKEDMDTLVQLLVKLFDKYEVKRYS